MRIKTFLPLLLFALSCLSLQAQQSETQLAYINRYKDIAVREMERSGIPASIKLAQGILESNSGQSVLARRANNHFGIKCGSNWEGDTVYREDDDYDANGQLIKSCFRSYKIVRPPTSPIPSSYVIRVKHSATVFYFVLIRATTSAGHTA